uniref:ATP synthase F0 subunit 8 n=1 Tax=Podonevadne trigona TaxID=141406 RepID=UPI002E79E8A2|nr:ATP synthase F0 subunit 8 [Podonevadne trigona]WPT28345.1 ATP synthase F0 subunit 8 [Podonevadne trigona]
MPQIWPMNWMTLFIFFILNFTLFVTVMHFGLNAQGTTTLTEKKTTQTLAWKW